MTWEEKYKLLENSIIALRNSIILHEDTPEDPDPPSYHSLFLCGLMAELIRSTEVTTVGEVIDEAQEKLYEMAKELKNKDSEPKCGADIGAQNK